MPDWTKSMQQSFEYYIVDPKTWCDDTQTTSITSCSITRDSTVDTLGSATIGLTEDIGEQYVRAYLITIQNGIRERHPLGTFLVQTPSTKFDGKNKSITLDAYTPLLELKENMPPIGFTVKKDANTMAQVYTLTKEHVRAPVVEPVGNAILYSDFTAETNDTWLTYLMDLAADARYTFDLDELSRIIYQPYTKIASLQPRYTFTDDNSSILYPEMTVERDLYNIPNAVEVIYTESNRSLYAKAVNMEKNSPISTVNRGREILYRVTNPELKGVPDASYIKDYAERVLSDQSTLEYSLSYTHAYCPVRVGDCVLLNYRAAGLSNVKAKIVSQTIKCEPGTPVTEKAVYTQNLWR